MKIPKHTQRHTRLVPYVRTILALTLIVWTTAASAQQNLAQDAYLIFQQNCLNCHGEHGAFTENLIIEHTALLETGAVVPGSPIKSELYTRLFHKDITKRMPLGQPQLSGNAITTIGNWILAGAPNWEVQHDVSFIATNTMLTTMQQHLQTIDPFDRPFARYFTMTHLYNAGETPEALNAIKSHSRNS